MRRLGLRAVVNQFFITGLPRSRTAWLANLMSTGSVICLHEVSMTEFADVVESGNYTHVGMAHTQLYEMMDLVGDSPLVVIDRDIEDVWKWAEGRCSREWLNYLHYKTTSIEAMRIPFEEINSSLNKMWKHLVNIPFDSRRAELLMNYNVQVTDKRIEELK